MPTSSGVKSYSLVAAATYGATGTGLDQIVEYIYRDLGLAGATDGKDIKAGAQAANRFERDDRAGRAGHPRRGRQGVHWI